MWESIRVREVTCCSFSVFQVSLIHKRTRPGAYHDISFFHELFVEDVLAGVCL